mmetsp:Transcript_6155/g.14641  ORF Transcript_6155/g.14641 Transcript_6155/m.14641 type:complete len:231 (-) Transcript_6155:86-778(-)
MERAGKHYVRTIPTSGDAWPGLFFDVEAKSKPIVVRALAFASHVYRLEKSVCINVFACNESSIGNEGSILNWDQIFSASNCSLPAVSRHDNISDSDAPYGQVVLNPPVKIAAESTIGFAIYTSSLCGLALRWTSSKPDAQLERPEDEDEMGLKIGNATVPIVSSAQKVRRDATRCVRLKEVTDSNQHLLIRAGLCSPVTGADHPFKEEDLDRDAGNVRAFVGEVIYDVEK